MLTSMTVARSTADAILLELRACGIPSRAEFVASEYMSSNLVHLGCTVPDVRRIAKGAARALRGEPDAHVVAVALELVAQRNHDSRQAAYELLGALPAVRDGLTAEQLEALARDNDNWAAVDAFCSALSGPQYARGLLDGATLRRWARSSDPWTRRAALATVATAFGRAALRTTAPLAPSFAVCEQLADDRHDHVVKALSWALRSLTSRDRAGVEQFLARHEALLAARVKREVRVKLTTGVKNARRR